MTYLKKIYILIIFFQIRIHRSIASGRRTDFIDFLSIRLLLFLYISLLFFIFFYLLVFSFYSIAIRTIRISAKSRTIKDRF